MASSGQKALGDAAAGAGAGASVGGPYGAAIGGVLGGLYGLFSGSDSTPQAPLFSDINLQKDNPELFRQLQAQQAAVDTARAAYESRTRGITPQEEAQYARYMGNENQVLGSRGMLGTSQGQQASESAALEFNNQLAQQRQQQQANLMQQWAQQQQALTGATREGLQQTYAAAMVPYQQAIGQAGNSNQLYSGLLGGGLQMLGQGLNQSKLNDIQSSGPTPGQMLPNAFGYGAPGQGITFQGGQNPMGGGYAPAGTSFGNMPLPSMMPNQAAYNYSFNPSYSQ